MPARSGHSAARSWAARSARSESAIRARHAASSSSAASTAMSAPACASPSTSRASSDPSRSTSGSSRTSTPTASRQNPGQRARRRPQPRLRHVLGARDPSRAGADRGHLAGPHDLVPPAAGARARLGAEPGDRSQVCPPRRRAVSVAGVAPGLREPLAERARPDLVRRRAPAAARSLHDELRATPTRFSNSRSRLAR